MHDSDAARPDHERLFQLASERAGYFTSAQARRCGFSHALLGHHAREGGRFIRVRRGLYRFRQYPSSPREDVLAAWLSVDGGEGDAAVSHDSALELLGLSDVVPDAVHVTIPRSKRYRPAPPGVRVHTTTRTLAPGDVVIRDGIRVTVVVRSIVDAAQLGTAPEQVIAAATQAVDRGMATATQLLAAARERGGRVERLVRQAFPDRARP
jgi:predicted transcriptional regulator of viral defense system